MTGLQTEVQMQVNNGQIIISSASNPRAGWAKKIDTIKVIDENADKYDAELNDWEVADADGLEAIH